MVVLSFEGFEFDSDLFELRRDGQVVPIEPQVHDVLAFLLTHRDRVVPKEELLDHVWGDRFVSESALTSRIKAARRAIGDDGQQQRLIRTVHGRGYRFVASVTDSAPVAVDPAPVALTADPAREPLLAEALAAAAGRRWEEALELFAQFPPDELEGPELEQWAKAAWWTNRIDEVVRVRHIAYRRYLSRGQPLDAARVAVELAEDHFHRGAKAVDSGWMARAGRLLADHRDSIEYLWFQRGRCIRLLEQDHDYDAALIFAETVLVGAVAKGDLDLQALALQDKGRALVALGEVSEGMSHIDEAMVTAVAEDLDQRTVGRLYCNMMSTCVQLTDFGRAAQWTEEAATWCESDPSAAYPGVCRVHRAAMLRRRGVLADAVVEAERCTAMTDFGEVAAAAWYELGETHLRLGDLERSEHAFVRAHGLGRDPQPGFAQLRHARGDPRAALVLLRGALAGSAGGPLERARYLPALVEAAVDAGEVAVASDAAAELSRLADMGAPALRATAHHAGAVAALAAGKTDMALEEFRAAARTFGELGMPYEEALARLGVAEACRAMDDCASDDLERAAARTALEEMGARPIGLAATWLDATPST